MKMTNTTPWKTADLRKFFWACIKEAERVEKPQKGLFKNQKNFILDINNTSSTSNRGTAWKRYYGNRRIRLGIPNCWEGIYTTATNEMSEHDKVSLARLIIHEYYHLLGHDRQDRNRYKHDFTSDWDVTKKITYLIIRKKEIKKAIKKDLKEERYIRAKNNLKRAETRYKRAKTLRQKYIDKVKYYEKNN